MNSNIKLYFRILKSLFWKSRDTKWIILMASLVITMVSVISSVGESIEKTFLQAIYHTSQYDFIISDLKRSDAESYIDHLSNKYPESYKIICTDSFILDIASSDFYLNVIGMEGDCQDIYRINLVEGEYPKNENEIVLDDRFRDYIGDNYKVGDEVEFEILSRETLENEQIKYKICGFFIPENNGGYELYGFMNLEGADRALKKSKDESSYAAMVCAKNLTPEVIHAIVSDRPDYVRNNKLIFNESRCQLITDREEASNSFVKVFRYIGIFIAITSFALLFNLFQMTTTHKVKQLGLMRCIGLNKTQLIIGLFFNLILYLISSMGIGFILYTILEKVFGKFLIKLFLSGFNISQVVDIKWHFNQASFIKSVILVSLIMILVYGKVVCLVLKMTPLNAIEYRGESVLKVHKKKKKNEKLIVFLGKRNLSRHKWQSFYTGITVFATSFLICTIVTLVCNIDLFNMDSLRKGNLYDYEFYGDGDDSYLNEQDMDKIANLKEVDSICGARKVVYEFFQENGDTYNADTLVETRVYEDVLFSRICKENDINYDKDAKRPVVLLLSSQKESVDKISLYDKKQNKIDFSIYAMISKDNYSESLPVSGRVYLVMNKMAAQSYFGKVDYNVLLVSAKNKADCFKQIEMYLENNGIKMYYQDLKTNNSDARTQLQSIVCIAIYLIFCVGIMALSNILCMISINIQRRMYEYGIMISMGLSRKQVVDLIVYEIMTVVEKAVIISLPFSILISLGVIPVIGQQINIIRIIIIATFTALVVYGVNYLIIFLKGRYDFSLNILGLMQNE